jgi:hypothetical protein
MAKITARIQWATTPADHDYPAAAAYLGLLASEIPVDQLVHALTRAPTVHQQAKDILRAAWLPLLGMDDREVAKDLKKIHDGVALSPVLLVRGDLLSRRPLQIADGYHRVCATYHVAESAVVPCRLVDAPSSPHAPEPPR